MKTEGEEKMNKEEEKKMDIEELCREELAWAEEVYDGDLLDSWLNGYRNALYRNTLRTVLRHATRGGERMNKEERENVHVVTRRLVKACLELRYVISTLPEGEDAERLRKGMGKIEDGLGGILLSLEVQ